MEHRYRTTEEDGVICITEQNSDYQLIIDNPRIGSARVCFRIPNPTAQSFLDNAHTHIHVTGRSLLEYPKDARELRIYQKTQYAEVGPGFGAFLPNLAMILNCGSPKPIAIDLFNYQIGEDMLQFAKREEDLHLTWEQIQEIDRFLKRKQIITNPNKVRLINTTLGEAVRQHPEILETVDVLVDSCGAMMYADTEMLSNGVIQTMPSGNARQQFTDRVFKIEQSLLKPKGRIIY